MEVKKELKISKNSTWKNNFYLPILSELKQTTNLSKIQEKLNLSKQKLNYYLRELKKKGLIVQKQRGWYEVVKISKNSTKYGIFLHKDSIRGHGYVWNVKLPQEIEGWNKRIEVLKSKGINFKLVGAKLDVPRIKVLGRKIWLCKDHLRVFDRKDESYYGENAKESRNIAFQEIKHIVGAINNKLGTKIKPTDIFFQKEHYALIKNDLAIEENKKGNIWRINDEEGEWLLIDDSLEKGGELENVGKKAYKTNIPMQNWWNDHKKLNFEVTPTKTLELINGIAKNQIMFDSNFQSHLKVINQLSLAVDELREEISRLKSENKNI